MIQRAVTVDPETLPSLELAEAEIVQLVRSLVGLLPIRAASEMLAAPRKEVSIGRTGIALIEDSVRRGLIRALARRGGGAPERTLDGRGGASKRGRLWQRHAPPALVVTEKSGLLLRWLMTTPLLTAPKPLALGGSWGLGDELFAYLVAERLLEFGLEAAVANGPFKESALCSVAFPVAVGASDRDLSAYVQGPGAVVFEGLAADLALKVRAAEQARRAQINETKLLAAEASIRSGPVAYVRAAIQAGRPDLGLFVLSGMARLMDEPGAARAATWTPALSKNLPLSARQRVARSAAVWLEAVNLYREVAKRARATGFVDDDHEAAQLLLTRLEAWQERRFAQAEALDKTLASLEAAGT